MKGVFARLIDWFDDRTGFRNLRHHALDEPLPAGTGWWFTLGSVLLFTLAVQVLTGICLALFYAPTPDHAWDSVKYITDAVRGGSFLRGLHHWGASIIVVAALLHMVRVVFFGSYRKPREVNWIVGLVLLNVILAFGLTGYLLPWDQRAYWATVVAINISRLTPGGGEFVASLLRGGADIGALTLTRWYAIHVMVLPLLLGVLIAAHLYLMRRQGISGPVRPQPGPSRMFFPYQAARDLTMAVVVGVLLAVLAWKGAPALEPPADPTSSDYIPRPEWYFLGLFQLLKYFPGRWEVVGALFIPGLAMGALALLPWLDRGRSREARQRLGILVPFTAGLAIVVTLTTLGARDMPKAGGADWNIQEIGGAAMIGTSDRCTRCHRPDGLAAPIQPGHISKPADWVEMHVADPEVIAAGVREAPQGSGTAQAETKAMIAAVARLRSGPPPALDEGTRRVYTEFARHCVSCHMVDGAGGKDGPDLSHAGLKLTAATIEQRIIDPKSVKPDSDMPAFGDKITPEDIRAIANWLASRR
ncbi:MAG TPA: cytochrome b N-terminal domain-containing protein [Vicinamibacterales bacterium]|nr:cytochrome b N-terminal domain-containing protein [Vicinamibacterales bacterium]